MFDVISNCSLKWCVYFFLMWHSLMNSRQLHYLHVECVSEHEHCRFQSPLLLQWRFLITQKVLFVAVISIRCIFTWNVNKITCLYVVRMNDIESRTSNTHKHIIFEWFWFILLELQFHFNSFVSLHLSH